MKLLTAIFLTFLTFNSFAQEDNTPKTFKHESSLSTVKTGGNAVSESYNFATDNEYKPGSREYRFYANYTLSYADDPEVEGIDSEETARNWQVGTQLTQDLAKKLGGVLGLNYEGNEYAGYEQRENIDAGLKYEFVNTDKLKSSIDVGYRYTTEKRVLADDEGREVFYFSKGNSRLKGEQKLNTSVSYKVSAQYLPNFTESEDYQINFEPSLTVKMTDILSLRVAYKAQYDNQLNPGVTEYLDHTTTTAFVAKFSE